jgi:ribosome-associated protein
MVKEFKLQSEYIELIRLLKYLQIAETGGHAKMLVDGGEVLLNGEIESRKRAKLRDGDVIEVMGYEIRIIA